MGETWEGRKRNEEKRHICKHIFTETWTMRVCAHAWRCADVRRQTVQQKNVRATGECMYTGPTDLSRVCPGDRRMAGLASLFDMALTAHPLGSWGVNVIAWWSTWPVWSLWFGVIDGTPSHVLECWLNVMQKVLKLSLACNGMSSLCYRLYHCVSPYFSPACWLRVASHGLGSWADSGCGEHPGSQRCTVQNVPKSVLPVSGNL